MAMQLRAAEKADLRSVAEFITDRFWGLEQYTLLTRGITDAREIMARSAEASLQLFHAKGDVCICGGERFSGVLVGIEWRKFSLLNIALYALRAGDLLRGLSRADAMALRENGEAQEKVHDRLWHRKYTRNAYYINWIAVTPESKGTGVFRQLITPILDRCDERHMDVVLETHTASNVPIYEHFGFELMQTCRSDESPLVEYCMLRRSR